MPQKIHLLISLPNKMPESFTLEEETITLGRSPDNDIQVLVSEVSTKHCELHRTGDGYEIADLNSTNGTKVNGTAINSGRVGIKEDDVLLLGETISAYVVEAEDGAELDFVEKIKEIKSKAAAVIAAPIATAAPSAPPAIGAPAPSAPLAAPSPPAPGAPPAIGAPAAAPAAIPVAGPTVKKLSPPGAAVPAVAAAPPTGVAPPAAPKVPTAAPLAPPAAPAAPPSSGDKTVSLTDVTVSGPPSGPLPVPQPVPGGAPPPALKVPTAQPAKKLAVPPPSPPKP